MEIVAPPFFLREAVSDPRISVGEFTYFDQSIELNVWREDERIEIGRFCSIAKGVTIFGGGNHYLDRPKPYPPMALGIVPQGPEPDPAPPPGPTIIGHDVWLAAGATVMAGSRIGHGAVVGARAVVAGRVPPYAIVAGNPARLIRLRFRPDTVERLLAEAWWDWPVEKVRERAEWLYRNPDQDAPPPRRRAGWLPGLLRRR